MIFVIQLNAFSACDIFNLCYLKLIVVNELDKELAPLVRNLIKVAQNTLITPHPTLCRTWSWTLEIHAAIERPSFTASRKVTRACRSRIIGTRLLDLIGYSWNKERQETDFLERCHMLLVM